MKPLHALMLSLGLLLSLGTSAAAETKVSMKGVHLCCQQCLTAVEKTLADVKGVKGTPDQEGKSINITADNDESAQKAIDALTAAGFHGKLDNEKLKVKAVEAPKGKVQRLEITNVHNCCGACTRALKATIKEVKGVTADTVKAKESSFVVEGDFEASELVNALLNAGFHLSVKK